MGFLYELIPRLKVPVPKFVEIDNHRLGAMLLGMRVMVVLAIGYVIYNLRAFQASTTPNDKSTVIWASLDHGAAYDAQAERDFATEAGTGKDGLCNPADTWFDYHWSESFVYNNIVCRQLPIKETFVKTPPDKVYIRTYFEETQVETAPVESPNGVRCEAACDNNTMAAPCETGWYAVKPASAGGKNSPGRNAQGDCICQCGGTTRHWVAGVEGIHVALEHSAQVLGEVDDDGSPLDISSGPREKARCGGVEPCFDDLVTLVVTHDRKIDTEVCGEGECGPGEGGVSMSVRKLLELSGKNLDTTLLTNSRKDAFPGPHTLDFPTMRLTGATVNIELTWYNNLDPMYDKVLVEELKWEGRTRTEAEKALGYTEAFPEWVCIVTVKCEPTWQSWPVSEHGVPQDRSGAGSYRYRYYYGLNVKLKSRGSYSNISLGLLSQLLVQFVVYLGLPLQLVSIFAQYGLGYLSVVYRGAIRSKLNFEQTFAGTLARALAMRQAHKLMRGSQEGVPKEVLNQEITSLFECREDQTTIVDSAQEVSCVRRLLSKQCEFSYQEKLKKDAEPEPYGPVFERDFVDVAINNDIATLRTVAKYVDDQRAPGFLESFFDETGHAASQRRELKQRKVSHWAVKTDNFSVKPDNHEA